MSTTNLNLETIEATDSISNAFLTKMNSNMNKLDSAYGELKLQLLQKTGKTNLADAIAYIDSLVNAQDATATADKIFNGYTAYKGTEKITGTALATASVGNANALLTGNKLYTSDGTLITGTMQVRQGNVTSASGSVSGDDYRLQAPAAGYYTTSSYLTRAKTSVLSDLGVTEMPTINITLTGNQTSYVSGYGAGMNKDGVLVIWASANSSSYEHITFIADSIAGQTGKGFGITGWDTLDPTEVPYACTVTGLSGKETINVTLEATAVNTSNDYVEVHVTVSA